MDSARTIGPVGLSAKANMGSTDPMALSGTRTGRHLIGTRPIPGISEQGCTRRYAARRPKDLSDLIAWSAKGTVATLHSGMAIQALW